MSWRWRHRGWLLGAAAGIVFVPVAVAAFFVEMPYYLISPGEARGVTELIEVEGDQARVYDPEGEILFTTVTLTGKVNAYEVLFGWLDDEIEVVPEERITGGASRSEVREINIAAMDESKLTATKVALEKVGYRVPVGGDGALVTRVVPGSPAEGKLAPGDIVVAVDGEPLTLSDELVTRVRQHRAGDAIDIGYRRGEQDLKVALTAADAGDGQARIGVEVRTAGASYRFPFEVNIDTGLVGGPSAGLAFTLALIDELSPGELTGNRYVAVTGTIAGDGTVGRVGGAAQKAVTAREAGAELFLVPPDELAEAKRFAGKMRVVPVNTLDEALAALEGVGGSGVALPAGVGENRAPGS